MLSVQCNAGTPPQLGTAPLVLPADQWGVESCHPWRYIVVHHSATATGCAADFDKMHRARGWDELGYHFVIGNGTGSDDGQVEVGPRWRAQKWGAHTGHTPDNEYNNFGIGICLVGDFTAQMPTAAQLAALRSLTAYLAARYRIPDKNVIGHRDAPNATTQCPGDQLYYYVHCTLRPDLPTLMARGG